ncbi:MAG: archemetzincin [Thermoprotei archaeon]|nr:MAG: archemetzincin [Thermoprotei archaeon]
MTQLAILLQPLVSRDDDLLLYLANGIEQVLGVKCFVASEVLEIPREFYDVVRGQYISDLVLQYLKYVFGSSNFLRVLGVADVDAYSNGLNFVFGQAELGGKVAVIYLPRLRCEFYGMEPNRELFLVRALKEAIHELGHTFGLEHCSDRLCVMSFSNSILDTDRKSYNFCSKCRSLIESRLKRYLVK